MKKKSFSYAEAMVTMLIVAIIMVATTPILTQRRNVNRQTIWGWARNTDGAESTSAFFGTAGNQRVVLGSNNLIKDGDNTESARLVVYKATTENVNSPIMRFIDSLSAPGANTDIGRLITTTSTLGLGANVLTLNPSGTGNTAIGANSLSQSTTGNNNTAIGNNACSKITDGAGNVCIGASAGPTTNQANKLYINNEESDTPLIAGDFDAKTVSINGALKIKRGENSDIDLDSELTRIENRAVVSDARLKNVSGISTAGLAKINKIVVKNFTFKSDKKKTPHVGVIAQELQKIFPNSVTKGDDGYFRINTDEMFYAMLNAIKELDAKFSKNDAKVQKMEQEIENLRKENAILTQKITEIEQKLQKK